MDNIDQENRQSQFPKMKAFKTIQQNFAMAGINQKLLTQPYPLNWEILFSFFILTSFLISIGVNMCKSAKSFIEYTQSITVGSGVLLIIFALIILILEVKKLFEFIDRCDSMLNTSKWNSKFKRQFRSILNLNDYFLFNINFSTQILHIEDSLPWNQWIWGEIKSNHVFSYA